ncbi:MAG: hypothetical protein ASARMPRED_003147 [Alectoria sarmentosa]|nr:MAG: hypothetical protein ASARMPRED_003147 [Alectoria sarmentosa]
MHIAWSNLFLAFGLTLGRAPLVKTAATTSPTPSTMVTMTSAKPIATESLYFRAEHRIVYRSKVATPTPGSVGILNGQHTKIPNDTVEETIPTLADYADPESTYLYQPWNTSYPGTIHKNDWAKYLQIWDPVWWSTNLDSLRQTSCLCSQEDYLTSPQTQLASYMNFEYYSHQLGNTYSISYECGPTPSATDIHHRITSGKNIAEHCWTMAGGEFPEPSGAPPMDQEWYCDAEDEFCVKPWRNRMRELRFRGHVRTYDYHGVHTWSEIAQVVSDVCKPVCVDKFLMQYNDYSPHNPSFLTTFYPPKPIDLNVIGD